ncbi:MAG: hypothetical protein ACLFV6_17770 [Spirulinaceae cyanobacterium]
MPEIYFYLPPSLFPSDLPQSATENWPGFGLGIYAWTIQTYLHLRNSNFPCHLTSELPDAGIVFAHHNVLRSHPIKPSKNILLIDIKAEGSKYPFAPLHIVQNPTEVQKDTSCYFLPHWPQPGLLPREHRDRVETVAFFGHADNLAPELQHPDFANQLASMGLQWHAIANRNHWTDYQTLDAAWHDYRTVDAIVAVRSFTTRHGFPNKPATKLYNSWLSGVPALLGVESAYRSVGTPGWDYIEVKSVSEVFSALSRLQGDREFYQRLVANGHKKAQIITFDRILGQWCEFVKKVAIPAYFNWQELPDLWRYLQISRQVSSSYITKVKNKLF